MHVDVILVTVQSAIVVVHQTILFVSILNVLLIPRTFLELFYYFFKKTELNHSGGNELCSNRGKCDSGLCTCDVFSTGQYCSKSVGKA